MATICCQKKPQIKNKFGHADEHERYKNRNIGISFLDQISAGSVVTIKHIKQKRDWRLNQTQIQATLPCMICKKQNQIGNNSACFNKKKIIWNL